MAMAQVLAETKTGKKGRQKDKGELVALVKRFLLAEVIPPCQLSYFNDRKQVQTMR